eukprot:3936432-Amphidinium_carterae.2
MVVCKGKGRTKLGNTPTHQLSFRPVAGYGGKANRERGILANSGDYNSIPYTLQACQQVELLTAAGFAPLSIGARPSAHSGNKWLATCLLSEQRVSAASFTLHASSSSSCMSLMRCTD